MSNSLPTQQEGELREQIASCVADCENCIGGLVPSYKTSPYETCPVCHGLGTSEKKVNAIMGLIAASNQAARSDELEKAIQQFLFGADNFTEYAHARSVYLQTPPDPINHLKSEGEK